MLQNAYFLAKIGADTAENEQHFAEILPKTGNYPTGPDANRLGQGRGRADARAAGPPAAGRAHQARAPGGHDAGGVGGPPLRSEVSIELEFPPKLRGARSRLYRRRFLQVNTRWKALAEIYTMHSFAPFSNLNFFVKNRQNFFAIELMNIH